MLRGVAALLNYIGDSGGGQTLANAAAAAAAAAPPADSQNSMAATQVSRHIVNTE
jgi:hypothetical protein